VGLRAKPAGAQIRVSSRRFVVHPARMPTVLVPLADGFEEIEAFAPIDLLRRAGVEVTTAALGDGIHVTGRSGITAHADTSLAAVAGRDFDLLFLPGGAGVKYLRADPRIGDLVRRQHAAGRWLAAICAAPTVLHDASLLSGKRYTAHFSVAGELPAILGDERIVTDGKITTSRGAGTAVEFGLHLVALLTSPAKAAEISKAICL
jgi:4-methyl-5(b-hydroxyethyl)-thiazole monophosphate biosynthesis